mgnify:FL=1
MPQLMQNSEKLATQTTNISLGNVYVMTHSLFSDVVKIGCTVENPVEYAKALSEKTIGEYRVAFSLECSNPCKIKKKIKEYLNAEEYTKEFYQVSSEVAAKLLKREVLKIPGLLSI